jgi:hypothetical protein
VADTPSVPRTNTGNPELDQALNAIIETLDIREGRHGHPLDQVVTRRDLVDVEVAELANPADPDSGEIRSTDTGPAPAKITGLTASGGFGRIALAWGAPPGADYVEIWRSDNDNLGEAVLAGTASAQMWTDGGLPQNATRYYWVRGVNGSTPGPYSDPASATTVYEPEYLIGQIEEELAETSVIKGLNEDVDNLKSEYFLRVGSNGEIAGFGVGFDGDTSSFIVQADRFAVADPNDPNKATFPFVVADADGDGNQEVLMDGAYIHEATVDSAAIKTLDVNKLVADDGSDAVDATIADLLVGNATITSAQIAQQVQSTDYAPGSRGWAINKDGWAEFYSITARGDIRATSLDANTVRTENMVSGAVAEFDSDEGSEYISGSSSWHRVRNLYIPSHGMHKDVTVFYGADQSFPNGSGTWNVKLWLDDVVVSGSGGEATHDTVTKATRITGVWSGWLRLEWYGERGRVDHINSYIVAHILKA